MFSTPTASIVHWSCDGAKNLTPPSWGGKVCMLTCQGKGMLSTYQNLQHKTACGSTVRSMKLTHLQHKVQDEK